MWGRSSLEKRQPWAGNPRGEIAREPCWDRRAYPSTSTPLGHSRGRRSTPTAECGRTGKRGGELGDDNPALPGPRRHYQRPEEDRYNHPEEYLRARIVGALGGRGAEEIAYGSRTNGAENDIEQATDIARRIVTRWDMSDEVDMVALAPRESPFLGNGAGGSSWGGAKPYSEETAQKIDAEVERIIRECHERVRRLLTEHRGSSTRSHGRSSSARRWTRVRSWLSRASLGCHASKTVSRRSRTPPMRTGSGGIPADWSTNTEVRRGR
jgi:Peptidase family M41